MWAGDGSGKQKELGTPSFRLPTQGLTVSSLICDWRLLLLRSETFSNNLRRVYDNRWVDWAWFNVCTNIGYTADGFYRSKDPTNSINRWVLVLWWL